MLGAEANKTVISLAAQNPDPRASLSRSSFVPPLPGGQAGRGSYSSMRGARPGRKFRRASRANAAGAVAQGRRHCMHALWSSRPSASLCVPDLSSRCPRGALSPGDIHTPLVQKKLIFVSSNYESIFDN